MSNEMTIKPFAPRRILFRCNVMRVDFSHLEAAAAFASERQAELIAQCIGDLELLRASQLPFTAQIGLTTARRLPWTREQLLREITAVHTRMREALNRFASNRPLRWQIAVEPESTGVYQVLPPLQSGEVLALSPTGLTGLQSTAQTADMVRRSGGPVLLFGHGPGTASAITAVVNDAVRESAVLEVAENLAASTGHQLTVLASGSPQDHTQLSVRYRDRQPPVILVPVEGLTPAVLRKLTVGRKQLLLMGTDTFRSLGIEAAGGNDLMLIP